MSARGLLVAGALLALAVSLVASRAGQALAAAAVGEVAGAPDAATPGPETAEAVDPGIAREQRAVDRRLRSEAQILRWRRARGQMMAAGLALIDKGQHRAAIDQFRAVLELFPQDEKALGQLARCYLALKDYARAEALANRTALVDPRELGAVRMRAKARAGLGRYQEALVDLETVLRIMPGDRASRVLQAELYERAKMPHHALRAWDRVRASAGTDDAVARKANESVARLIREILEEQGEGR